jgi:vitamin B12 transporter
MRRLTTFFLVLLLQTPALFLRAEEPQTSDSNPSYQITVTGDRLEEPVNEKSDSVSVITRDQIEAHQWRYVIDALRTVPGVSIVQSGSPGKTTSTFVRGAGSTQVLVLVDGIPINDPYFGQVQLENLVTDNVERIEVLKGPQSPLYGSDAMSGVIQIFTRKGAPENKVNVSFEGGSYDTFRERAGFSGQQQNLDYSLSFSRQDSNGQLQNDDFGENAFVASGGYRFTDADRLTLTGQVFDAESGLPYGFGFVLSPHQRQDSLQQLFGSSYRHNSGSLFHLNTALSYTRLKYHFEDPDNAFSPFSDSKSGVLQFTAQNDAHLANWNTLTAGYEYERQKINASDNTGPYIQNMIIRDNALFVQDKVETVRWIASAGFRWDHYTTFGNTVNPRISLGYKPVADLKIRGSYGRAFRAPSAGELALPYYGNPDLKTEKSRSWEIGVDKYWQINTTVSAAWFDNHYDDLISFDPQTFLAVNIAKATTRGLELSAATHHGHWTYSAGYTYLYTHDELTGLRLFRRPTHSGNFAFAYDTPRWGTAFSLLGVGNRFETDYRSFPYNNVLNPGYGKADITGYYQVVSALKLQMRIENVLNKNYEEALGYEALGRGFYAGITGTF